MGTTKPGEQRLIANTQQTPGDDETIDIQLSFVNLIHNFFLSIFSDVERQHRNSRMSIGKRFALFFLTLLRCAVFALKSFQLLMSITNRLLIPSPSLVARSFIARFHF